MTYRLYFDESASPLEGWIRVRHANAFIEAIRGQDELPEVIRIGSCRGALEVIAWLTKGGYDLRDVTLELDESSEEHVQIRERIESYNRYVEEHGVPARPEKKRKKAVRSGRQTPHRHRDLDTRTPLFDGVGIVPGFYEEDFD